MKGLLKSVKGLLKTPKGKAVLGGGTVAVVGAVVAVAILLNNQGYRTIAVQEVNGTSIIKNEKQEISNAYVGMHLNSGDDVTVQAESDMTLLLDMDKYVYAEENTHFWLEAEGDSETSKTRIYLEQGAELNRLNTELTKGEEYQVDTPNSVMAVRGTVFRVCVYYDSDGLAWTKIEVYDGNVEVSLKTLESEFNGVSEVFGPGESALIRASSDFSEFVVGEDNEVKLPIDYEEIPQATALKLVEFIDDGDELCIGKELLMDYTKLEEHKMEEVITEEATCTKEGQKEVRCTVCNEIVRRETIAALGHVTGDWQTISNATCISDGQSAKVCTRCGATVETMDTEALGHSYGDWTVTSTASCTSGGSLSRTCSRCGSTETSTTAATGHSYVAGNATDATCTTDGSIIQICTICGHEDTTLIPATGHTYVYKHDWLYFEVVETEGTVDVTVVCSQCDMQEPKTTHTIQFDPETEKYYCVDCDKDVTEEMGQ